MSQRFINNFSTLVAATFGISDTQLRLDSTAGLPILGLGEYFYLTVYRQTGIEEREHEVIKVTNVIGDTLTVVRAVEGAAASQFLTGDRVQARVTALSLQNKADQSAMNLVQLNVTSHTTAIGTKASQTDLNALTDVVNTKAGQADLLTLVDTVGTKAAQADLAAASVTLALKMNTTDVTAAIAQAKADLVNSSPSALDTLKELATALGNDANFAATTAASIGARALLAGNTAQDFSAKDFTAVNTVNLGGPAGSQSVQVTNQAGGVNYLLLRGAVTGSAPIFKALGTDANISLNYQTKGTGQHVFYTNATIAQLRVIHVDSAVNCIQIGGGIAGGAPFFAANGADTHIGMYYGTKGFGNHIFANGAGNTQLQIGATASSVNYVNLAGGATGTGVLVACAGADANIEMAYQSKGSFGHVFSTGGTYMPQFKVAHTISAVNYLQVNGGATGASTSMSAQGADANIPIYISSKGTGQVVLNSNGGIQMATGNVANPVNWVLASGATAGNAPVIGVAGSDANIDLVLNAKGTGGVKITNAIITGYTETYQSPAPGAAITLDPSVGTLIELVTTANCTITLPAAVAGRSYTVIVTFGGAHTLTFAGGTTLKWADGAAPTATSVNGKSDIFVFTANATKTFGRTGGKNY